MKFEDYDILPEIKFVIQKLGYKRPTDIQFKAIPAVLKGNDLLAIAQTGTGKTAAFAIPIIDRLHKRKKQQRRPDGIKCLIMVPTRELALQIGEVMKRLAKRTRVRVFALTGGVEQGPQINSLNKGIDVLVTTPGRMFDLASQGHLRLERVEVLVLDEADHMLDLGFIKDIKDVVRKLPKRRQTLFFSATIDEKIKKLAYLIVSKPILIKISPKDPVSKNVDHSVLFVKMEEKRFFLERLLNENKEEKILVFVRTKVRAERVAAAMKRVGIEALTLHGDKEQIDRQKSLKMFSSGKVRLLVATDVSARGIDIDDVGYVVNYDLPDHAPNYVHRIGRTGRGKNRGLAVSFCSEKEIDFLKSIENYVTKPIKRLNIEKLDYKATLLTSKEHNGFDVKALIEEAESKNQKRKRK